MLMLMGGKAGFALRLDAKAACDTCAMFLPIFLLIFAKGLVQIWRSSAVSLCKSETVGEKPPRANYALGLAGVLILAGAYYIALSIESPLAALAWFFVAVCMVIASTYLLFIAGSVTLCRILKNNKKEVIFMDEYNELDSTCGVSDEELTIRFREAVRIENEIKRIKKLPIARYDYEKKMPYIEYPDGRKEYAKET